MMNGGTMFSKGDIVVVHFPFSDLMNAKKRPMLVLGVKGEDLIGCAITSNPDSEGVALRKFSEGGLPLESKVKYWQIHTFLSNMAIKKIAKISKDSHKEVLSKIDFLFKI